MKIDNNTDYSALFSSLGNNSQNNFSLNDYASIKNGSYGKLMKAYYGKNGSEAKTAASSSKTDETTAQNMSAVQKSANELKDASKSLSKAVSSGDSDTVYKAAKDFADKYNSLMTSAGKVESNKTIKRTATNLMNEVASNLRLLNKAGIKMSEEGKMSVDEKAVKAEDNTAIKALFDGKSGSFGDQIENKASNIANRAQSAAKTQSTYTAKAAYNNRNVDIGSFYDSFN
ncbi:MAG: hypothetical protein K6E19_09365 [Lachnospiraceae bacterium]|nr:hypothetical protein [Lachnospiraceae bacterium]